VSRCIERSGFTLIELAVFMSISAVVLAMGTLACSGCLQRNSARSAAQVFAQDLFAATSFAICSQERVGIRF
jgi:prepilin-type N-terminal cleavage/methylation domain-containing protein